jgi:hypothetical protein
MDMEQLEKHIYELESRLLQPEVRQSSEKIAQLLSDDFFEFCTSGQNYRYKKGDIINDNNSPSSLEWEIKDFRTKLLSPEIVLATYKTYKHDKSMKTISFSLRSSLWRSFDGQWKMVFHQGTPIPTCPSR